MLRGDGPPSASGHLSNCDRRTGESDVCDPGEDMCAASRPHFECEKKATSRSH